MRSGQTSLQEQGRQLESVRDEVSFPLPPLSALLSPNLLPLLPLPSDEERADVTTGTGPATGVGEG